MPKARSPDSASGRHVSQPLRAPLGGYERRKKPSHEVLTYHQIPLLTLDWNNDKQQEWENSDMDDFWTRAGKLSLAGASQKGTEERPPGRDMWGSLLNGTDENPDKGASVCEVWQAFLNGPGCQDHSGVPESEWLQTAASVSPSNRYASSDEGLREFLAGMDTPTTLRARASAACQLLSAIRETRLADVALNAQDHQPAEGCGARDDNTVTRGASQRSQTKSVTDTPQEFSLTGATPVSEGSVDSSAKCHRRAIWGREGEEIIGEAEATGGDEPFTLHTADLVTSSGESQTTDMTAMPESQNATSVDRISQGARLHEGLSSSGEKDVTGTTHNARHDTLAFKETIRQGTKDGEGPVACTSRRAAEERICNVSTEEEIFRPLKMKECEISQSYADEKECGELRMNQTEGDENEMAPAQPHAQAFDPKPLREDNSETGGHALVSDQTEEGKRLSGITEPLRETNPTYSSDKQSDPIHDGLPPFSAHERIPNAVMTVEPRWTHSQEDEGGAASPEEITVKEAVAQEDTLTRVQRRGEPVERPEEDASRGDGDAEAAVERLGNAGGPGEGSKNTPAQVKGGELSAEVERHQPVECEILSEGTKDPITADSGQEDMLIERFAAGLVSGVCEEVFGCNRDTENVGGTAGRPDITHDCHVLVEKGYNGAFDSAVLSLSTGPKLSLPTIESRSNKRSRKEKSQSLTTAAPTHPASELRADFNSSACLGQDRTAASATLSGPKSAAAVSSGTNQEDRYQIKRGSVTRQETGAHKHASSSSGTLKQSRGLILYSLSHITRLLMCALLVVGSFALAFLYDLPAFFALYVVSLCYWLYKWRRRRRWQDRLRLTKSPSR